MRDNSALVGGWGGYVNPVKKREQINKVSKLADPSNHQVQEDAQEQYW